MVICAHIQMRFAQIHVYAIMISPCTWHMFLGRTPQNSPKLPKQIVSRYIRFNVSMSIFKIFREQISCWQVNVYMCRKQSVASQWVICVSDQATTNLERWEQAEATHPVRTRNIPGIEPRRTTSSTSDAVTARHKLTSKAVTVPLAAITGGAPIRGLVWMQS